MTPTTPYGWYSRCPACSASSNLDRVRRGPSTFRAWWAAKSTCSTAATISMVASAIVLPVSVCTSSASASTRLASKERQRSIRFLRPSKPSPAHQLPASRARATAAVTAASSAIGTRPASTPVAGLVETRRPSST